MIRLLETGGLHETVGALGVETRVTPSDHDQSCSRCYGQGTQGFRLKADRFDHGRDLYLRF